VSLYRGKGRQIWTVKVPTESGRWRGYSTGTKHQATARRMLRMVEDLGPRGARAWDVLKVLHDGTKTLPELHDLYHAAKRDVAELRALLAQTDLESMVESFLAAQHCTEDTKQHYKALIRRLMPEGQRFPVSEFTSTRIQKTIDDMKATGATKRKCGAAIRTFANWLIRRGTIRDNPMRQVRLPRAAPPRTLFLETADAKRLADAQPSPYRELSALLAGSGIEVSVALELRVRDVDQANKEIRAKGTKTHARDRVVRVADWGWEYLLALLEGKSADDYLFETIPDRFTAGDVHRAAIAKLSAESSAFAGYTMRDHRHTYAVRAIRAGTPADLVARQLGHVNAVLVLSVYGRFQPTQSERDKWERAATAMDNEKTEQPT
jgi:integrase